MNPRAARSPGNVVLAFLVAAYTLNFIDRSIIGIIGEAIKVDLLLTDTQLGLLGGLAFALLYTSFGLPIARIAERWNRVNLIAIAIVMWSGFTALCGLAQNFVQLLLFRAGVGVGEAGLSPAAHSLISDHFEPRQRASALAIYAFGIPLGSTIGAIAGGWIAQTLDWRWAFMLVGLPGLTVALALKMFVREPRRSIKAAGSESLSVRQEMAEVWATARELMGRWPTANLVLGVTIVSFADYGVGTFAAPYFIRQFSLDLATVGLLLGVVGGISTGTGTLLGGVISDRLAKRTLSSYALVPAVGLTIAAPVYVFAYLQNDWRVAFTLFLIPGVFHYAYLGPAFGVIQNTVAAQRRATATALLLFIVNLIGLGLGPPFVGWLNDQLAAAYFAGSRAFDPLQAIEMGTAHGAPFVAACPGGQAPAGSAPDLAARCTQAAAHGARQGILITYGLFLWAALHFLLASIGLAKLMRNQATA
jgi:predicted MFS family arabinose efflux permease